MGKMIVASVIAAFLVVWAIGGYTHVDPGEVGILIKNIGDNKGMQKNVLSIGTTWVEPYRYDVVKYDTKCRQMQREPEELKAQTGDGQPVDVDFTLEICLVPEQVPFLHTTMGRDYYDNRVHPRLLGILKNMVPSKPSDVLYTSAGRLAVEKMVNDEMDRVFGSAGIRAALNLRDIKFTNAEYVALLEQKASATQRVEVETRNGLAAAQTAIKVANIAEGNKQSRIKAAEAAREEQRLAGEGLRLRKEEDAKGILAVATAEARGTQLRREALSGPGGASLVSIEWAKNLGPNIKVYGFPTGAPGTNSIMDLNGMMRGALSGKAED